MKYNIINFLKSAFPFLVTVGLWRLSAPFWNPAGILAIIPVFFYSFVRPIDWFVVFSVIMCMLIDYNFNTVCFWIAVYCFAYSVNGFQNFVDIKRMDFDGLFAFMIFFGLSVLVLMFANFTWTNIGRGLWMFVWAVALYRPFITIFKRVQHD